MGLGLLRYRLGEVLVDHCRWVCRCVRCGELGLTPCFGDFGDVGADFGCLEDFKK